MSAQAVWLAAGRVGDPMRVPDAVREAMYAAGRVEVGPAAEPALALWARPECVVSVRDADGGAEPEAGVVRVAVDGPARAAAARWQVVLPEPAAPGLDASLRGATVIVTRPWPDILLGAPAYAVRGGRVVPWPLSALVPPPDPDALERAAAAVADGRYACVGVTSARAAEAWCGALACREGGGQRPFVVAIGQATAAALVTGGLPPDLVTEGGSGALGQALGEHARGGPVLLVAAAGGRTDAEDAVRARGCAVEMVAAYGMADPPWRSTFDGWVGEALRTGGGRGVYVTWFSPRGIERGMRVFGARLLDAAWVTVGEVTARAARAFGMPVGGIEVAETASAAAVREAVVRLHRMRRRRHA